MPRMQLIDIPIPKLYLLLVITSMVMGNKMDTRKSWVLMCGLPRLILRVYDLEIHYKGTCSGNPGRRMTIAEHHDVN